MTVNRSLHYKGIKTRPDKSFKEYRVDRRTIKNMIRSHEAINCMTDKLIRRYYKYIEGLTEAELQTLAGKRNAITLD